MDGISSTGSSSSSSSSSGSGSDNSGFSTETTSAALNGETRHSHGGVMVLATTNCPWDLDDAMRRRLEKRVYVPLPDLSARRELFALCLRGIPCEEQGEEQEDRDRDSEEVSDSSMAGSSGILNVNVPQKGTSQVSLSLSARLAAFTEGYSGADVRLVCREASMVPMRRLLEEKSPLEIQMLRKQVSLSLSFSRS
jgi:katanin p60 ATPase-containing subunit A1